jgi:hypothetical protein
MSDSTRHVRRALGILDFTDEDSIVTEDTFDPVTGRRTSRQIYRTSAWPDGVRKPAERYLLAADLPVALAVHPDCVEVSARCVLASGEVHTVLFRSLLGDTAAQPIASYPDSHVDADELGADRHHGADCKLHHPETPAGRAARLLNRR